MIGTTAAPAVARRPISSLPRTDVTDRPPWRRAGAGEELIAGGLYTDLANSCFPGRHRKARALSPTARFARIELRDEGRPYS